jgi:hypothetical protein
MPDSFSSPGPLLPGTIRAIGPQPKDRPSSRGPDGSYALRHIHGAVPPAGENPTVLLHNDLELIEHLDRLGFDEAWIGEHHSAGTEIIASPEIFIAAAANAPTTSSSARGS